MAAIILENSPVQNESKVSQSVIIFEFRLGTLIKYRYMNKIHTNVILTLD